MEQPWYDYVASIYSKIEISYFPYHSPDSLSVNGSRQDFSIGKQKRDNEDELAAFGAETDTAVGSNWLDDTMTMDTAGTTLDTASDAASSIQTPASSVDSDIIQRIDPHLLSDKPRQG